MVSYQWTVRSKRVIGRLPIGAWVEIIKTNTTAKPTPLEIFRAFESKYVYQAFWDLHSKVSKAPVH